MIRYKSLIRKAKLDVSSTEINVCRLLNQDNLINPPPPPPPPHVFRILLPVIIIERKRVQQLTYYSIKIILFMCTFFFACYLIN